MAELVIGFVGSHQVSDGNEDKDATKKSDGKKIKKTFIEDQRVGKENAEGK